MKRSIKEEFRAKEGSCLTIDGHLGSIRRLTAEFQATWRCMVAKTLSTYRQIPRLVEKCNDRLAPSPTLGPYLVGRRGLKLF